HAVRAVGHPLARTAYLVEHGEQVLLRGHRREPVDRHRGVFADAFAERDRPDLAGGPGQLGEPGLQLVLALGQHGGGVRGHPARVRRWWWRSAVPTTLVATAACA